MDYMDDMDFNGPTWRGIKAWAAKTQENKIALLIGADSHDKSNQIRGSLLLLRELLALEKAADMAAKRG